MLSSHYVLLYHHNIYIYILYLYCTRVCVCVCILVIMIQHVIRRHKTPITIVLIMKTQCEAVQKGIDENTRHRSSSSAARGWKNEIKRVYFKRVDPTALERISCIYLCIYYVCVCVCVYTI